MKTRALTEKQRFALEKLRDFGPCVLSNVRQATKASLLKRGLVVYLNAEPPWLMLTPEGRAVVQS